MVSSRSSLENIFVGDCWQYYCSAATGKYDTYGGALSQKSETEESYALYFALVLSHPCCTKENMGLVREKSSFGESTNGK